jgi:SAM-dependent methyltransferase
MGITMVSTNLFMYQVVINRVFSVLLPYHFTFLILSTAILGMGFGSIIEFKETSKKRDVVSLEEEHGKLTSYLAYSMLGSFLIIYFMPFIKLTLLYIPIVSVPYIFAGRFFANIFTNYGEESGKIYFFDLMGAGLASALTIGIFYFVGFIPSITIMFILVFLSSLFFSIRAFDKKNIFLNGIFAAAMFLIAFLPNVLRFVEKHFTSYLTSPYTSVARLNNNGDNSEIIYTNWDGFARTDVIKLKNNDSTRIVSTNGSANALMIKYDGISDFYKLKNQIDFLPYLLNKNAEVAIIGAGGGRDVLQALMGGAKSVDAIEINRSTVDAVKSMGEYNGNIYENPKVNVIVGDGRSLIEKSKKEYDIIFLSMVMTGATQANGYALAENYIYTKEAIESYYKHLKKNGKLVFLAHGIMDMTKISNTLLEVLLDDGVSKDMLSEHIFTGGKPHGEAMIHSPVIMLAKTPYSDSDFKIIDEFSGENGYSILNFSDKTPKSYIRKFSSGEVTLKELIKESEYDVSPSTDERPFFYNFQKGIPVTFIIIIATMYLFKNIFFRKYIIKNKIIKTGHYFSLLGIGFMMIEVAFIQKMSIYLEHPTTAFVVTISSLLVGAGIGSYFSQTKWMIGKDGRHKGALIAFLSLVLTGIVFKFIFTWSFSIDIWKKLLIAIIIIMVNGLSMGTIFPYSIAESKRLHSAKNISIFYGINGIFSMLGSILAIIISMNFGVTTALFMGAGVYGIIYMIMPMLFKESSEKIKLNN